MSSLKNMSVKLDTLVLTFFDHLSGWIQWLTNRDSLDQARGVVWLSMVFMSVSNAIFFFHTDVIFIKVTTIAFIIFWWNVTTTTLKGIKRWRNSPKEVMLKRLERQSFRVFMLGIVLLHLIVSIVVVTDHELILNSSSLLLYVVCMYLSLANPIPPADRRQLKPAFG